MQQQQRAGSSIATSILVDAPDVWLAQLLSRQYLDSDSELSLFQTCKKLNEVVMQHRKNTSVRIDPLARPRNRVLNMLQTANKHAPTVKLILHDGSDNHTRWRGKERAQKQMKRKVCSILKEAAKQGATTAITELELEDTWLKTVLPRAIGKACPNLSKLTLFDCAISFDREISTNQHFQNLRALVLDICDCDAASDVGDDDNDDDDDDDDDDDGSQDDSITGKNKQRVAAVSSLTIAPKHLTFYGEAKIINSLAASLTHLRLEITFLPRDDLVEDNLNWVQWARLRTLQHIQLTGLRVGDEAMEKFLNMPCLTHVMVHSFGLEKSFAGLPCSWEELVVTWSVDAKTLAYLPLHPGMVLKLGRDNNACRLQMNSRALHLLPQAISNAKQAMAIQWVTGQVSLTHWLMEPSEIADWLAQGLPLVKDVTSLNITSGELNGAAMQTLCEFAQSRDDELCIRFSDTYWVIEDMIKLVKHMPHSGSICLRVEGPTPDQHIIQLCCAAQKKLALHVNYGYRARPCEQRIRSATQACGIEVLSLVYGNSLDVTVQPLRER